MGSRNASAYLASPAVVAASALAGKIAGPKKYDSADIVWSVRENEPDTGEKPETTLLDGMPAIIKGELLFCYQDNLNTDGIYPGKYTYVDDITPEQQAGVVMENYDPLFNEIAEKGDILVGGFNFGSGSSREQAATALKYRGIQLVVAGSSSQTFKRNALNNGFLVVEAPELVQELKNRFGTGRLTVRTSIDAKIDLKKSVITADGKDYSIDPVGTTAQELVLTGGMESWIKKQLSV